MKIVVTILCMLAFPAIAQVTINLTVTLNQDQVWALTQDWIDYQNIGRDTNGVTTNTLTKLQWFTANCTNEILRTASRRVDIRRQETLAVVQKKWGSLTPEQQTNIINTILGY